MEVVDSIDLRSRSSEMQALLVDDAMVVAEPAEARTEEVASIMQDSVDFQMWRKTESSIAAVTTEANECVGCSAGYPKYLAGKLDTPGKEEVTVQSYLKFKHPDRTVESWTWGVSEGCTDGTAVFLGDNDGKTTFKSDSTKCLAAYSSIKVVWKAIDCVLSDSITGVCSKSCGGGISTKTTRVNTYAQFGGVKCPDQSELIATELCNEAPCPLLASECLKECLHGHCGDGVVEDKTSNCPCDVRCTCSVGWSGNVCDEQSESVLVQAASRKRVGECGDGGCEGGDKGGGDSMYTVGYEQGYRNAQHADTFTSETALLEDRVHRLSLEQTFLQLTLAQQQQHLQHERETTVPPEKHTNEPELPAGWVTPDIVGEAGAGSMPQPQLATPTTPPPQLARAPPCQTPCPDRFTVEAHFVQPGSEKYKLLDQGTQVVSAYPPDMVPGELREVSNAAPAPTSEAHDADVAADDGTDDGADNGVTGDAPSNSAAASDDSELAAADPLGDLLQDQ